MSAYVTIGVCAKNAEKTIEACISSIINQNYPQKLMQAIVIDGCSKDKTIPIIIAAVSKTDLRVEMSSDKGKGLGTARQIAVDHAIGRYVIFVDADAKLFEDFVEKHVKFMEENPRFGVAFGKVMLLEGTLVSTIWNLYLCNGPEYLTGCDAAIFRSEAIAQAGGFDKNIRGAAEDIDLIDRIKAKGWLFAGNSNARFFHRSRENLGDFWDEQSWFGYGYHYLNHKNDRSIGWVIGKRFPVISFIEGLGVACKAYKLNQRKISFLIPFQLSLRDIAWWCGFVKAHRDGYGHVRAD
jgi:glycosyltransferase involved in cell wall biosynthesis